MSCPLGDEAEMAKLKTIIQMCRKQPAMLHVPQLAFLKDYLESMGATIPPAPSAAPEQPHTDAPAAPTADPHDEIESDSDLELDMEGCIPPDPDTDPTQLMGDEHKLVSEEEMDKADEKRIEATAQLADGNFNEAVQLFTDAIQINSASSILFVKRGQTYLKLNKPNACIRDCTRGLELNPDSAAAYKYRGRAYRLIGEWERAAQDLRQACKIDFDEQTDEWLKEVTPNALKIEQHLLKVERKKHECEQRQRAERVRKAKEAHESAQKAQGGTAAAGGGGGGGFPQGAPGGPAGMGDFYKLLQDPELMAAFKDPEVSAAFQDISMNPGNIIKYQSNPKIMALIAKLSNKFQGANFPGGFPGAGMFGGGNAGAGGEAATDAGQKKPPDDLGLD